MNQNQSDKYGRNITKTDFGNIELRYYSPDRVSNEFIVGERIEWVETVGDTDDGPTAFYQCGVIKKITLWTVLLEIDSGQQKRLDKAFLENRVANRDLAAAIQNSLQDAVKDQHTKKKFHPIAETDAFERVDIQQCFLCQLYYTQEAFIGRKLSDQQNSILSETCPDCYQRTANKISAYNGSVRKNGGQLGLRVVDWLEKLKASQGYCTYCKKRYVLKELIIEHIMPLAWGGDNTVQNVTPACIGCNSSKGDRDYTTWQRHLEAQQLLERLQNHLGLSAFEVKNLAIRKLAESQGIVSSEMDGESEGML